MAAKKPPVPPAQAAGKAPAKKRRGGMPTPKSTKNMPPGLANYWKKRGVKG